MWLGAPSFTINNTALINVQILCLCYTCIKCTAATSKIIHENCDFYHTIIIGELILPKQNSSLRPPKNLFVLHFYRSSSILRQGKPCAKRAITIEYIVGFVVNLWEGRNARKMIRLRPKRKISTEKMRSCASPPLPTRADLPFLEPPPPTNACKDM